MKRAEEVLDLAIKRAIGAIPHGLNVTKSEGAKTGTVVFCFPYQKGFLIGADRQITWGYSKIYRTNFRKIWKINKFAGAAMCGSVSMCQFVLGAFKRVTSEIELRNEETLPLRNQAAIFGKLMRSLYFAFDGQDIGSAFLYVGLDPTRKDVLMLEFDSDASVLPPDKTFLAIGSGQLEAKGVLEESFADMTREKLSEDTAIDIALKVIKRSAEGDIGVGHPLLQSATIALIDVKTGFAFVDQDRIKEAVGRMK